jgi:hypothetical protein
VLDLAAAGVVVAGIVPAADGDVALMLLAPYLPT